MDTPFIAEYSAVARYSDFTLILGCVFVSIILTGGVLLSTRLILNLIGWV